MDCLRERPGYYEREIQKQRNGFIAIMRANTSTPGFKCFMCRCLLTPSLDPAFLQLASNQLLKHSSCTGLLINDRVVNVGSVL